MHDAPVANRRSTDKHARRLGSRHRLTAEQLDEARRALPEGASAKQVARHAVALSAPDLRDVPADWRGLYVLSQR